MGYVDDIMVTGEVKNLKKMGSDKKFIIGDGSKSWWSNIFFGNKSIIHIDQIKDFKKVVWLDNYPGHRPYRIYNSSNHKEKYIWNKKYKAQKGEIFFSNKELESAKLKIESVSKPKCKRCKKILTKTQRNTLNTSVWTQDDGSVIVRN